MRFRLSLLVLCLGLGAAACAQPGPPPTPTPGGWHYEQIWVPFEGVQSYQEAIADSDAIVRATLSSTSTAVETRIFKGQTTYSPALVFTLNVLEYLKGSGGDTVTALAVGPDEYETSAEAEPALVGFGADRDTQWDDRQAIIFLRKTSQLPSTSQADRYLLGSQNENNEGDTYSLSSRRYRQWLPDASSGRSTCSTSASDGNQRFLLEAPSGGAGGGGAASSPAAKTVTLATLKKEIADIEAEIASGDGSEEYKRCVWLKYVSVRTLQYRRDQGEIFRFRLLSRPGRSGAEAGLVVETVEDESGDEGLDGAPDNLGRYWIEGPDKDYVATRNTNLRPTSGSVFFDVQVVTTRPLPAGLYRYHLNRLDASRVICNEYHESGRNAYTTLVRFDAPAGVRAEALFDPVVLDGVSAWTS